MWTGKVENIEIRWGNDLEEKESEETAEDMREILQEKMQEAWRTPEATEMKRKLSKIKKIWE